jgi:hypothetical protein
METASLPPEERRALLAFLADLHHLLELLIERPDPLLSERALSLLRPAWQELLAEGRFEALGEMIGSGEYDGSLALHGLRGAQLELKTGSLSYARARVDAVEGRGRPRRRKRFRELFGWGLKTANVLLGSLAQVLPPAGAVKEVKDAAEAALDERLPLRTRAVETARRIRARFKKTERLDEPEPVN